MMLSVFDLAGLVEARLRTLEPGVLVFMETPPDESSRGIGYVIVDMDPGRLRYSRAAGPPEHDGEWRLRVCGSSRLQALNTLDLVRSVMDGWRPLEDPRYGDAREDDAGPEISDLSVPSDPRWSYTLTYKLNDGDDYA